MATLASGLGLAAFGIVVVGWFAFPITVVFAAIGAGVLNRLAADPP